MDYGLFLSLVFWQQKQREKEADRQEYNRQCVCVYESLFYRYSHLICVS